MARLSKRSVDALPAREKDYFSWDSELPGFGVRVAPTGRKSFVVQYRNASGQTRRKGLGRYGIVTAEDARKGARAVLAAVAEGADPSAQARAHKLAPTVSDLCNRFMADYAPHHCRPTTRAEYRRNIDRFIKPHLGMVKVPDVTRTDIAALHLACRDRPYQANRNLGVLSVMFNQAEIWGLRPDGSNPCRHVKKYKEEKRQRFLTAEEFSRLGAVLAQRERDGLETAFVIAAFRLLILTGCRLSEIATLKWDYLDGNRAHLPDSKTGAKTVYLGAEAMAVLDALPRDPDNPYVIQGKKPGHHITDLQRPWRRIRQEAGLADVRIHDLRHTFASVAAGMHESLYMTGKLLGHSQPQTTARYAHLADDPMQASAGRISGEIAGMLYGNPK